MEGGRERGGGMGVGDCNGEKGSGKGRERCRSTDWIGGEKGERVRRGMGGRRSRRGTACLLFDLCQFVCNCGLQFKIDGAWHTWIHYDKFHKLVSVGIAAHRCIACASTYTAPLLQFY